MIFFFFFFVFRLLDGFHLNFIGGIRVFSSSFTFANATFQLTFNSDGKIVFTNKVTGLICRYNSQKNPTADYAPVLNALYANIVDQ